MSEKSTNKHIVHIGEVKRVFYVYRNPLGQIVLLPEKNHDELWKKHKDKLTPARI